MNQSAPKHFLARQLLALGFAVTTLTLAGCKAGGSAHMAWTGGENEEVEFDARGTSLSGDLELLTTRHERRDGLLFVQLELFNKHYGDLAFEWKLDWYDQNGFITEAPLGWVKEVFGGKETRTISGIAPNTQAVSWRLTTRRPNTVH